MSNYLLDPLFWLIAGLGVTITGISKSGLAGGAGVVAVPLLALILPVPMAAALMLPLLIVMDIKAVSYYHQSVNWPQLKNILPAAIVGIALAGWTLNKLPTTGLQIILGAFSVVFSLWQQLTPLLGKIKFGGLLWGGISGISSTLLHAGGPPINIYFLSQQLPKLQWLGTSAVFFAVMNSLKIIPYTLNQQWSFTLLQLSMALVPFAFLGIWLGKIIQQKINNAQFLTLCRALLFFSGLGLLIKSFI